MFVVACASLISSEGGPFLIMLFLSSISISWCISDFVRCLQWSLVDLDERVPSEPDLVSDAIPSSDLALA